MNIIKITELPITSWTDNYKIFLETTILERKDVKSILNNSTESTVDFTIKFDHPYDSRFSSKFRLFIWRIGGLFCW